MAMTLLSESKTQEPYDGKPGCNFALVSASQSTSNASQAAMLQGWRCDKAQGFLFHRPMLGGDIAWLLSPVARSDTHEIKEAQQWVH